MSAVVCSGRLIFTTVWEPLAAFTTLKWPRFDLDDCSGLETMAG